MGQERGQLALRNRLIAQPELDWNVIKPARSKAAVEVPQAGYDDPDNRHFDIRPRLIENQEIKACALCDFDAGEHLAARRIEKTEFRDRRNLDCVVGDQE